MGTALKNLLEHEYHKKFEVQVLSKFKYLYISVRKQFGQARSQEFVMGGCCGVWGRSS